MTLVRLRVTADLEMGSAEVGSLPIGTMLSVLEWRTLLDGTKRARAQVCPGTATYATTGWITSASPDGTTSLGCISTGLIPCDSFILQSLHQRGRDLATGDAGSFHEASFHEPSFHAAHTSGPNLKTFTFIKRLKDRSEATAQKLIAQGTTVTAKPSAEYQKLSDRLREQAAELQKRLKKSFRQQLGEALARQKMKVRDIVDTWTRAASGTSTKMEFRKQIRKLVIVSEVKTIDDFFDDIDRDKSGIVDAEELATSMYALYEQHRKDVSRNSVIEQRLDIIRDLNEKLDELYQKTLEAESIIASLEDNKQHKSTQARIGSVLFSKQIWIAELVREWHVGGEVSAEHFRQCMRSLDGLQATDEELDEVFNEFDEDGGGTLDKDELKVALTSLREVARETNKEIQRLEKAGAEAWSQVARVQQSAQQFLDDGMEHLEKLVIPGDGDETSLT